MSNRFKILKSEQHQNIITVDCDDFDVIDFGMSIDNKITLFKRGYKAMNSFFETSSNQLFHSESSSSSSSSEVLDTSKVLTEAIE